MLALAAEGTTAGAARLLHLAQPSVSRALLSLEDRLETRLFDRSSRGLVSTPAGRRLSSGAGELLEALRALERNVRPAPPPRTRVRLVCACYTAYHWLPSTLEILREELPDLDLLLRLEHTAAPVVALHAHEIDAALLTAPLQASPTLKVRALFSDEIIFVVARTHPLANKPALTPDDLRNFPLLMSEPTNAEARWFMTRVFGRKRPQLDVTRIPLTEAIVDLARAGMGIAVLTEWVATPHLQRDDIVAKRLSKGPLRRQWRLAWRSELGDVGPRLLRALKSSYQLPRQFAQHEPG